MSSRIDVLLISMLVATARPPAGILVKLQTDRQNPAVAEELRPS